MGKTPKNPEVVDDPSNKAGKPENSQGEKNPNKSQTMSAQNKMPKKSKAATAPCADEFELRCITGELKKLSQEMGDIKSQLAAMPQQTPQKRIFQPNPGFEEGWQEDEGNYFPYADYDYRNSEADFDGSECEACQDGRLS